MGTSGSFGGSKTASWKKVAEILKDDDQEGAADEISPAGEEQVEGDSASEEEDEEEDSAGGPPLAEFVAAALMADDPALKPKNAPVTSEGDSGLSFGDLVGASRRTGTSRSAPTSGRRQIAATTGRAGRAIGAGFALAAGNGDALRSYGLDPQQLQGMDTIDQIMTIMDALEIGNSGPNDIALRGALYDMLERAISDETASPIDTLRDFVCEYALQLFAVELDANVQNGTVPVENRDLIKKQLSDVIRADAAYLKVENAELDTPRQFEHAAQQLMRGVLYLVREGDGT